MGTPASNSDVISNRRRRQTIMRGAINTIIVVVVFLSAVVVWAVHDLIVRRSFAPQHQDVDFQEFIKTHPVEISVRIINIGPEQYFEVRGQIPRWAVFYGGSGPPAYVFDSTGRLVDWIPDIGDCPKSYAKRWRSLTGGKLVNLPEALHLIEQGKSAPPENDQE